MIKIKNEERRNFFRIDDEVHINFQPISDDEFNAAPDTLSQLNDNAFSLSANFATLSSKNAPVLNNIKQLHPDVGEYLDSLNTKIDSLSQHILYATVEEKKLDKTPVNLSASGIQFETSKTFEPQQAMKIELILLPEKVGVLVFGRVIESKASYLSIRFEHLRAEDQELMIKHNLSKQMSELRKKNDND